MAARARSVLAASSSLATRFSFPTSADNLVHRRGFAAGGDHHVAAMINIWQDPLSPSKWKEEHFVLASLSGWGLLIYGGYGLFAGKKANKDEAIAAPAHASK